MSGSDLTIIAGPCSVDENNVAEIGEIANIMVEKNGLQNKAITGTRVVGLKSRTALDPSGAGMGMDFESLVKNLEILEQGGTLKNLITPPSVEIAERIYKETDLLIATEIMIPTIQMPFYEGRIGKGKLMPWNPAVNQLGWQIMEMAKYAKRNGWMVGIKNGKWVGENLQPADSEGFTGETSMEKAWAGLSKYSADSDEAILIHRGVDVAEKGDHRSLPVHNIAKRTKLKTGAKLYFDPSHTFGPALRDSIVAGTIEAMKLKVDDVNYLYDGILVEVGTSQTDTEQHITLDELRELVTKLSEFRNIVGR